jgi:hypothetical protein
MNKRETKQKMMKYLTEKHLKELEKEGKTGHFARVVARKKAKDDLVRYAKGKRP